MKACAVCSGPYLAVSDDPSLSHPSCEPVDASRFEAATRGPRTYAGVRPALVWSTCAGCSTRIEVGDRVALTVIDGVRVWACARCSSPQIAHTGSAPVPTIPAPRAVSGELSASADQVPATRTTNEQAAPRRVA